MKKQAVDTKLKRDDNVIVIAGKDAGKTGRVLRIDRENGRVVVEGVNMVKKAQRRKSQNDTGGIIELEAPLHLSDVMFFTRDGKRSRLGFRFENGKKVRYAKKTGDTV